MVISWSGEAQQAHEKILNVPPVPLPDHASVEVTRAHFSPGAQVIPKASQAAPSNCSDGTATCIKAAARIKIATVLLAIWVSPQNGTF